MKVTCKGRCRGDGKLYTLVKIDDVGNEKPYATSFCGPEEVPCHLVELSNSEYVLVLIDFSAPQRVDFYPREPRDSSVSRFASMSVNPRWYSFASKFNGVFRKVLCDKIRNIDSSGINRELTFTFEGLIPCQDGFIARGVVSEPEAIRVEEVVAFDSAGKIVSRSSMFLNRVDGADGQTRSRNLSYSIKVPAGISGLCLAALDNRNRYINAVKVYKPRFYGEKIRDSSSLFLNAAEDWRYEDWLASRRLTERVAFEQRARTWNNGPFFSVIVPLYKTPLSFFRDMADSVLQQTYENWELVLVNSTPDEADLHELVSQYVNRDRRIRTIDLNGNLGITGNTNIGIEHARGDFLCFFDHDDVLEPDILFEYVRAIEADDKIDLLYCDEDKLNPDGSFSMPTFKPDFSIDMVRDNNYICHLLTVRKSAYDRIEPSGPELDGAQDHAMVLKISELGGHVYHVPKILYHWRISETSTAGNSDSKPYATEAGIRAVQQHLDRLRIPAKVSNSHGRAFRYRVDYLQDHPVAASLIVSTRGDEEILGAFLRMFENVAYDPVELILVCGASAKKRVDDIIRSTSRPGDVRVVVEEEPYSFASWANFGARVSRGECLVFMHDDVMPGEVDWLDVLVGFAMRKDVGVVGTMTCDLDGTIQQAGLTFLRDTIVPLSAGIHRSVPGYLFFPLTVRNVAAIDGTCFATSRSVFEAIGGLDERFVFDYANVDYCFAASALDKRVIYTPEAWMYHRAINENSSEVMKRNATNRLCDKAHLLSKWASTFAYGDSFFSPNFSQAPSRASLYKLDYGTALGGPLHSMNR